MSDFWQQPWPVTTLVTHERPHLDELSACLALRREGRERFPGIENSTLAIFNPAYHLDHRSEEEWLQEENTLFIGVRSGRFDDHPHERFSTRCALTLVLEHLGLVDHEGWSRLNEEVLHEDRKGTKFDLHLARLVKSVNRFADLHATLNLVELTLGSYLRCQTSYQEALGLVRLASATTVRNRSFNTNLTLCWIDNCDNEDFSRAARSRCDRGGLEAALVIQRNQRGNVHLSSNHYLGVLDLSWLIGKLRLEEQVARADMVEVNESKLQADGDDHFWYHQRDGASAYNGSLCYPHVEPTRVPLETIVKLATQHLGHLKLQPQGAGAIRKLESMRT